jgi:hypothetical protein
VQNLSHILHICAKYGEQKALHGKRRLFLRDIRVRHGICKRVDENNAATILFLLPSHRCNPDRVFNSPPGREVGALHLHIALYPTALKKNLIAG